MLRCFSFFFLLTLGSATGLRKPRWAWVSPRAQRIESYGMYGSRVSSDNLFDFADQKSFIQGSLPSSISGIVGDKVQ